MSGRSGRVVGINGNLVTIAFDESVRQNEVAYVATGDVHLIAEVIRVRGRYADAQVFEDTSGIKVGDKVEFEDRLLSVELGPGLLAMVYDGLQNPLFEIAEQHGFFLPRGLLIEALPRDTKWEFTPTAAVGDRVPAGARLGTVPEGIFQHWIMTPFDLEGRQEIVELAPAGEYTVTDQIAVLKGADGRTRPVQMMQTWPVKRPVRAYRERLRPTDQLVTKMRILDTFFPVAKGGTYCIPGPFGAGKTVLQQLTSRHADADVVVIAACGERAGEVVETLREFPELTDPRTGRSLMKRTVIICNTSSMPVAAREASVYTAVTIAEYYRQMGLNVLLLADSTSRWAQALRETSGRLEEIPGEEAFPAYLESVIAAFYERAGIVRLHDGTIGSVTIGGTVSPAGGDFEEPVTQSTLKVVGAFHGLSRARSDARRYPAIDPLESWSKYPSLVPADELAFAKGILAKGHEVSEMMKVVEEEGTSMADFILYLKGEYVDAVYLQQDAFDAVDGATPAERQRGVFGFISGVLHQEMDFEDKDAARAFFQRLTQTTRDWNRVPMDDDEFAALRARLDAMLTEVAGHEVMSHA
ncbi:MAG: V-type ATP synthase subunit A [Actinobacteria bacterium]|nr:V-type ATP synthase subunit A [Actinomycetota bacterium]